MRGLPPARGNSREPEPELGSILVLYHAPHAPLRRSVSDHLYSIRRYGGRPSIYVNLAARSLPAWIHRLDIDLVVFHTILLATRWQPSVFADVARRLEPLKRLRCPKIAIPQDEFLNTGILTAFLADHETDHVFTCAPESEWRTIYGPLLDRGIGITRVLTGYLEPTTLRRIETMAARTMPRDIDIGYRAWKPEPWLGRHGMLKTWVAESVLRHGAQRGLRLDISTDAADTLLGDAWYEFLLRSRYTIGAEGGASLHDPDGEIRRRVDAYVAEHPLASFEAIEAACFPGLDGRFDLRAISPRHLEACATRTPQVLVEGAFNGILQADRHYVPIRPDFGNMPEILDAVASGVEGREIAERAYVDVVASGRYGYDAFVAELLSRFPARRAASGSGRLASGLLAWERAAERSSWAAVRIRQIGRPLVRDALRRTGLLRHAKALRSLVQRRRNR